MINAIPTIYRGVEYRSRLEARWAVFFDLIGWHHTYEPFDTDGYIPDFAVHGQRPMLVEIKPAIRFPDYVAAWARMRECVAGYWAGDLLILGVDPLVSA
jgi:hypothetical protein